MIHLNLKFSFDFKALMLLFFFIIFFNSSSVSQENILYTNYIYDDDIQTVSFKLDENLFELPIIELGSEQKLVLEFDNLEKNFNNYSYTFIHCNSDWTPSNLHVTEYIEGYTEGEISDFSVSFNTQVLYNHYKLVFPEENIKPIVSGNYLLVVYTDYDIENVVLTRKFYVLENKIGIEGKVKRSTMVNRMDNSQEIEFSISDNSNYISFNTENLFCKIMQNRRDDNIISLSTPDYLQNNVYEYNNPRKMIFYSGNEFRYFNCKNYRYTNDRVASIEYLQPYYIFSLVHEAVNFGKPYEYGQDINGMYVITADEVENDNYEAEYVLVDFSLMAKAPVDEEKFYVYGELTDFAINEKYKMQYNFQTSAYELRLKLKQGFYNYQYVTFDKEKKIVSLEKTEGNHYETENDYRILVYFRKPGSETDELIGYKKFNSIRKL